VKLRLCVRCSFVEIAKALILAGRTAHDLPWPSVGSGPKQLVPVANRPILFHNLAALRRAGLLEAAIALEPDTAGPIMDAVGNGSRWGLNVHYVDWQHGTGLSGALVAARDFLADEPVLLEPADVLHRELIHPHIASFAKQRLDAMALRIRSAPCDANGEPVAGGYLLSQRAISMLLDSRRIWLEPVAGVRSDGGRVHVQDLDGCLACHGGQEQLLEANRHVLELLDDRCDRAAFPSCQFQGAVVVDPSAQLKNTLVRGPAIIGARARLSDAYVGPYSSIGADVVLDGCQIEHSIVLDGAQIRHIGTRLETSVIGRGARVGRSFVLPSAMRLSVGDGAEITLP
jgi:glucose-1-phosphate thymidylyltransferase